MVKQQQQVIVLIKTRSCKWALKHQIFLFCILCTAWAPACCITPQTNSKSIPYVSQVEYFQPLGRLLNFHSCRSKENTGKESPRRDTSEQRRESSMFVFLHQWCMTSLSHPADCLLGLHAHAWTEMVPLATRSTFTALQWLSNNGTTQCLSHKHTETHTHTRSSMPPPKPIPSVQACTNAPGAEMSGSTEKIQWMFTFPSAIMHSVYLICRPQGST